MQTAPSRASELPAESSILLRILLLYFTLAVSSISLGYLKGGDAFGSRAELLLWMALGWISATTQGFVLEYGRSLSVSLRKSLPSRVLFIIPALIQFVQDLVNTSSYDSLHFRQLWIFVLWCFDIGIAIVGVWLLHSAYRSRLTPAINVHSPSENFDVAGDYLESRDTALVNLLGRGDAYIDRVIHSVIGRSLKSERVATFSLIVMLVLVFIGGMASFGLWAFTHADRISSIEAERNKLTLLQAEMQELKEKLASNNEAATTKLDQLLRFVDQNYKTSPSYEATLNRLSQQSQSNYADIAIRVTIAVLTIFLVQVFFAVYKYNHHLAIMLFAKAEALELAGSDDDARKELSREAVSIVKEAVPAFGAQPRTPIEEIARLAEKVGKR